MNLDITLHEPHLGKPLGPALRRLRLKSFWRAWVPEDAWTPPRGSMFPENNWSCSQNIFVEMFPLFPENNWPLFPENNCPCSLKITAHVPLFALPPPAPPPRPVATEILRKWCLLGCIWYKVSNSVQQFKITKEAIQFS